MPAWPSFVPLVQEMLALAVSGQAAQRNVEVGQPLGDTVETAAAQSPLSVTLPDGRHEELRLTIDAQGGRWSFADTCQSGVYLAKFGKPGLARRVVRRQRRHGRKQSGAARAGGSAQAVHDQAQHADLDDAVDSPRSAGTATCTRSCSTRCWGWCLPRLFWPGGLDINNERHPSYTGWSIGSASKPPAAGEGTLWRLESTWGWAPWVTLLFAIFAVAWVG